jgi:hypothetical protein
VSSADPSELLGRNCAALEQWLPGVAELVRRTADDPAWQRAIGRDGTPTFQRKIDDHTVEWFGGTSMPAASAKALTKSMDPGETSGLGIGIGTGFEWQALLKRVVSGRSVIALETDAARVRRAFQVCDLSAEISAGKILVIIGESAGDELCGLLERHVGFEAPRVMHPLPTVIGAERSAMLTAGEAMVRRAVLLRHEQLRLVASAVNEMKEWAGAMVIAPTPRDRWDLPIVEAARRAGEPLVLFDRPAEASLAWWLRMVERHRPAVVRSTLLRANFEGLLPAAIGVETWLAEGVGRDPAVLAACKNLGGNDRLLVQRSADVEVLRGAGVAGEIVVAVPTGSVGEAGTRASGAAVAIVCDRLPYDAESCELTLPSHAAVWDAALSLVTARPWEMRPGMGKNILRDAQRKIGVELRDAVIEASIERGTEWLLLRGARVEALAALIAGWGIPVKLIGVGWEKVGDVKGVTHCERPRADRGEAQGYYPWAWAGDAREEREGGDGVWNDVGALLHLERGVNPAVREAAQAGVKIVIDQITDDADDPARVVGTMATRIDVRRAREQIAQLVKRA